jgi:hypothetical protein
VCALEAGEVISWMRMKTEGEKWEIEKCASDGCLPILNINYGTGMTVAN